MWTSALSNPQCFIALHRDIVRSRTIPQGINWQLNLSFTPLCTMEASQTDKTVVRQCADFYQSVYQPLISGPMFGVEDSETKEFCPGEDGVMKACWTCETSINVTNLSDTEDATVHVEGEFHKDTKPWDPPPIPPNESKSDRRYWGFQGVRIFNKSGRARIRVHVHW